MTAIVESGRAPSQDTERGSLMILLERHYQAAIEGRRHWLGYHLGKPSAFGLKLLMALAVCETAVPSLGFALMTDLANIPYGQGGDRDRTNFENLLQKLIEVVSLRTLVTFDWPEGTTFQHEPTNPVSRKKPELAVDTPERLYLFEVKCPGLISHQFNRLKNPRQLPARSTAADVIRTYQDVVTEGVTLPQDNKLKDFLASAHEKFDRFQEAKPQTGVLIVAWDEFMYEPISSLNHVESGLFTDASFYKGPDGKRVPFAAVDGAIVLNHLSVMGQATQENYATHRPDCFVIEANSASPNVWCANPGGQGLPDGLLKAFDAVPAEAMEIFADYAPTEFIMWMDPLGAKRGREARRRKMALVYGVCEAPIVAAAAAR